MMLSFPRTSKILRNYGITNQQRRKSSLPEVRKEVISIAKREPIDIDALLMNIAKAQKKTGDGLDDTINPLNVRIPAYRHEATDTWLQNGSRGVFEMATGTGKTYDAIRLRDYQLEAIDAWFQNGCHGIFEMATGTGRHTQHLVRSSDFWKGKIN